MKKFYLIAMVLFFITPLSYCQLRIALLGGPHSASVKEKNGIPDWEANIKPGYSARSGVHLGVLVDFPLSTSSDRWFFQPGIVYQAKGRKFFMRNDTATAILTDTISSSNNLSVNYIEFPLNLTYKIPLSAKTRFMLSAGPYVSFFYNGKQKFETRIYSTNDFKDDEVNLESGKIEGNIKTVDLGFNVRAGFELGNVLLTGFMSRGLTSFYNAAYEGTFKHQVIGASLGIWLNSVKPAVKQPKDRDKDGVPDATDACPDLPGLAITNGCPDKDGDGIADMADNCPEIAGQARYKGCPVPDTDNDGINDEEDKCPGIAGTAKYNGCPVPDSDADGINDEADACPEKAGVAEFNGCPVPDTDGDGINDKEDKCPAEAGTTANNGCPEIKTETIGKEIIAKVQFAAKNIFFQKSSDQLSLTSNTALDDLAAILTSNPNLSLTIEGHTDATGTVFVNKQLSQKRAESVLRYMVQKGIDPSRLSAIGYGSEKPVDTNKTAKGQARNRRVELKLEQH